MIRKSTFLAAVASAVIGLAMFASGAEARGHGGGGHGGHGGGMHRGGGHGGHHGHRGGHRGHRGGHRGHRFGHHRHHRHHHWARWHRGYGYYAEPVTYSAPSYVAARPAPCTCLSKEYTDEGAVVFKDNCTNESAINGPQQSGEAEQPDMPPQAQIAPPRRMMK